MPVRIGYLPITDAAPLLLAHAQGLFAAQGLQAKRPRLFRSWAQLVEAFISGQVNVIHLLSPATLWVRYGTRFPAKIVAWNHINGSALTVRPDIASVEALGGQSVAIPFWYSIHNVLLQQILRRHGLKAVSRPREEKPGPREVNLLVQPPSEMVSALASGAIAGFCVAEPFNALAERNGIGRIVRFSGDVWNAHACCVTLLAEQDLVQRPEWARRVTKALVAAQAWGRMHRLEAARALSAEHPERYTPHAAATLEAVFDPQAMAAYETRGVIVHRDWHLTRIDFQPYPFPSYTEALVRLLRETRLEGETAFLQALDPSFVARDLVDDRFVREAIAELGGPALFGLSPDFSRHEEVAP
nr:ABC transporter substrate-binding protein [Tepidiphilus margaritifer]